MDRAIPQYILHGAVLNPCLMMVCQLHSYCGELFHMKMSALSMQLSLLCNTLQIGMGMNLDYTTVTISKMLINE